MNAAMRAVVRLLHASGHTVVAFTEGFRGLVTDQSRPLGWMDVNGWTALGGTCLRTSRHVPDSKEDLAAVAATIRKHNIGGLIVVGGWEALQGLQAVRESKKDFPALRIPLIHIPATISNNIPGTDFTIGSDTALTAIMEALDRVKQSAVSAKRVFVVEVMGSYCGYLALMSALAGGAELAYIPEDALTMSCLLEDAKRMVVRFKQDKQLAVILRAEKCHTLYTTSFLSDFFAEEGKGVYETRHCVLGHLQQGGNPSPLDRVRATKMAVKAVECINSYISSTPLGGDKTSSGCGCVGCGCGVVGGSGCGGSGGGGGSGSCGGCDSDGGSGIGNGSGCDRGRDCGGAPTCDITIGEREGRITVMSLAEAKRRSSPKWRRPLEQWWLKTRALVAVLGQSGANELDIHLPSTLASTCAFEE